MGPSRPHSPTHSSAASAYPNAVIPGTPVRAGTSGTRRSGLKSRGTQLLAIRFGWVVLVIWYEVGEFFSSLSSCKFPDSQLRPSPSSSRWTRSSTPSFDPPTHLVLISDPHVPHPRLSYPEGSRPWINFIRQTMDELFMRKSWNVVMRLGRVDGVIVLGDMLDWGRGVMTDQEYEEYFSLFTSIFRLPPSIPMHYVPGNHDIPLGPHRLFSPKARDRYVEHFSEPNAVLEVANHSMILLDAVGLVEEDYRRYAAEMQFGEWDGVEGGVIEFVKALGEDLPSGPKILLSHIPLARPESASCGRLREHGRIMKGAGPGYQNLLGSETSRFLLDVLDPSVVFSGDDHDYCDLTHQNGIREVTLKSFSSSTGISRPGFQLLSLVPPDPSGSYKMQRTIADRPCFLPDQAGVYWQVYLPMAILTVLFLFGTNFRTAWNRWTASGHSIYGDLKGRISPAFPSTENIPSMNTIRRTSDRPVPLSLPSRKSSQHLSGLTAMTPSTSSFQPRPHRVDSVFSRSAPVSPSASPRLGYTDMRDDDDESVIETPNLSRRSSYIYMNGNSRFGQSHPDPYQTPHALHSEPSSYFLPLPSAEGRTSGSTHPSPANSHRNSASQTTNPVIRRSSSSNLGHHYGLSPTVSPAPSYSTLPHGGLSGSGRRVTMPRVLTTTDWSAAASKKEKSVLGAMMDTLPVPGNAKRGKKGLGVFEKMRGIIRWAWKTRNGVIGRSWREVVAVAWPPAVVWLIVNALFFWE